MSNWEFVRIWVIDDLTDRQTISEKEFPLDKANRIIQEQNREAIAETFFIVPDQAELFNKASWRATNPRIKDKWYTLWDSL